MNCLESDEQKSNSDKSETLYSSKLSIRDEGLTTVGIALQLNTSTHPTSVKYFKVSLEKFSVITGVTIKPWEEEIRVEKPEEYLWMIGKNWKCEWNTLWEGKKEMKWQQLSRITSTSARKESKSEIGIFLLKNIILPPAPGQTVYYLQPFEDKDSRK